MIKNSLKFTVYFITIFYTSLAFGGFDNNPAAFDSDKLETYDIKEAQELPPRSIAKTCKTSEVYLLVRKGPKSEESSFTTSDFPQRFENFDLFYKSNEQFWSYAPIYFDKPHKMNCGKNEKETPTLEYRLESYLKPIIFSLSTLEKTFTSKKLEELIFSACGFTLFLIIEENNDPIHPLKVPMALKKSLLNKDIVIPHAMDEELTQGIWEIKSHPINLVIDQVFAYDADGQPIIMDELYPIYECPQHPDDQQLLLTTHNTQDEKKSCCLIQ